MALREVRPGLRTIHNGSNSVAKASIVVAAGDDLTVPEEVAAQLQLQSSGAFKDGPAPQALLDALAASEAVALVAVEDERPADAEPGVQADASGLPAAVEKPKKAAAKKAAAKKG